MATHSSILAGEIPLTEEPSELQSMGAAKELDMTKLLKIFFKKKKKFKRSSPGRGNLFQKGFNHRRGSNLSARISVRTVQFSDRTYGP